MLAPTPATTTSAISTFSASANAATALSARDSSWFQTKKEWFSAKTASVTSFDLKLKLSSTPDWFSNRHWAVQGSLAIASFLSISFVTGLVKALWARRKLNQENLSLEHSKAMDKVMLELEGEDEDPKQESTEDFLDLRLQAAQASNTWTNLVFSAAYRGCPAMIYTRLPTKMSEKMTNGDTAYTTAPNGEEYIRVKLADDGSAKAFRQKMAEIYGIKSAVPARI
jgi:hypothetical protein